MNIFYTDPPVDNRCILNREESFHAVKVLRLSAGSTIHLTDGEGNLYTGIVNDPDPRHCSIEIITTKEGCDKRDYRVHIAISPLKNHDRFEWFIEKSVEIGIDEITPLICRRSLKTRIKEERCEKLIIAAMKQSLKTTFTRLNKTTEFSAFVAGNFPGIKMIAHCADNELDHIGKLLSTGNDTLILIGPEGDFTHEEIEIAQRNSFIPVSLGTNRLRTETAGIVACHSVYYINMK